MSELELIPSRCGDFIYWEHRALFTNVCGISHKWSVGVQTYISSNKAFEKCRRHYTSGHTILSICTPGIDHFYSDRGDSLTAIAAKIC